MSVAIKPHLLIVGIGNITHPRTRHSIGHYILDSLAYRCGVTLTPVKYADGVAAEADVDLGNKQSHLTLFRPNALMNLVGPAVGKAFRHTVKRPENLIVITDTLYHPPGVVRAKFAGQPSGHRGIRSIIKGLNHDPNFHRLLIGIGQGGEAASYVLGPLSSYEKQHWAPEGEGIDDIWERIGVIASRIKED